VRKQPEGPRNGLPWRTAHRSPARRGAGQSPGPPVGAGTGLREWAGEARTTAGPSPSVLLVLITPWMTVLKPALLAMAASSLAFVSLASASLDVLHPGAAGRADLLIGGAVLASFIAGLLAAQWWAQRHRGELRRQNVALVAENAERQRVLEMLRQSERILREAEELGHTGSWEHNLVTGQIVNTDENLRLFFGEDRGRGVRLEEYADVIHPDDRAFVVGEREKLLALDQPRDIEYRVVWPDGSVHWIFGRATVVRDESGQAIRVHGTNVEITERKQADEALREAADRLQQLSRRLLEVQEEERRHLARELHDEFGQLLATVTLLLHAARTVAGEAAQARLEECATLLRRAGEEVRSLALELRPTMLETVGLEETLRWLAQQHQQRTGIVTQVLGHVHDVSGDVAITCFRVVQEALTNVVRHAQAQRVWIELSQSDSLVELFVRDDGIGFDVARTVDRAARRGHLGLLGMRERVQILGGTVDVYSEPGQGTRLRISLPYVEGRATERAGRAQSQISLDTQGTQRPWSGTGRVTP
jgi:two-component system sensor histidine kinase UhpB